MLAKFFARPWFGKDRAVWCFFELVAKCTQGAPGSAGHAPSAKGVFPRAGVPKCTWRVGAAKGQKIFLGPFISFRKSVDASGNCPNRRQFSAEF